MKISTIGFVRPFLYIYIAMRTYCLILSVTLLFVFTLFGCKKEKKEVPLSETTETFSWGHIIDGNTKWDTIKEFRRRVRDFEVFDDNLWVGGDYFYNTSGSYHGFSGYIENTISFVYDFYMTFQTEFIYPQSNHYGISTLHNFNDTMLVAGGPNLNSGWTGAFTYHISTESWLNQLEEFNSEFYAYESMEGTDKLIAAGNYQIFNHIVAFTPKMAPFDPTPSLMVMGNGFNDIVNDLIYYQGELYACGNFTVSGATTVNRIAKFDGTDWLPLGNGLDGVVNVMEVYNNELYVGGSFTSASGVAGTNYIAKWDGTSWLSVSGGLSSSGQGEVLDICASDIEGILVAGGVFDVASSQNVTGLAYLSSSKTGWNKFDVPLQGGVTAVGIHNNYVFIANQYSATNDSTLLLKWSK